MTEAEDDVERRQNSIAQLFNDLRLRLMYPWRDPGRYVHWLLGQIVDAEQIRATGQALFFDWTSAEVQRPLLDGTVVMVAGPSLIRLVYADVPSDPTGIRAQGRCDIDVHSVAGVRGLRWTTADIDPINFGLDSPLTIVGDGWDVDISTEKYGTRGQNMVLDVYRDLTRALGL